MGDYFDENEILELRPGAVKELKVKLQEVDMVLELCQKELGVDKMRKFRAEVKVKLGLQHGSSPVNVTDGNNSSASGGMSNAGIQNQQVVSTPETRKTTAATSMTSTQKPVQEMEAPVATQKRKRHTSKDNEASARKKKGKHSDEDNLFEAEVDVSQNIAKDSSGPEEVLKQIEREMDQMNTRVSKFEYCIIGCRSIRVGSYKVLDIDNAGPLKVTITALGICFTLPYSHSKIRKVKVCIPRHNILSIQANLTKRLPVIFLKTGSKLAKWVRDALGMDGSPDNDYTNYYCPQTGSNCQRTITILTECFSETDVGLLRKMYADTLTEIDYQLASKFLMDITPERYKTSINYQPDSNSPAASVVTSGNASASEISIAGSLPMPTSRESKDSGVQSNEDGISSIQDSSAGLESNGGRATVNLGVTSPDESSTRRSNQPLGPNAGDEVEEPEVAKRRRKRNIGNDNEVSDSDKSGEPGDDELADSKPVVREMLLLPKVEETQGNEIEDAGMTNGSTRHASKDNEEERKIKAEVDEDEDNPIDVKPGFVLLRGEDTLEEEPEDTNVEAEGREISRVQHSPSELEENGGGAKAATLAPCISIAIPMSRTCKSKKTNGESEEQRRTTILGTSVGLELECREGGAHLTIRDTLPNKNVKKNSSTRRSNQLQQPVDDVTEPEVTKKRKRQTSKDKIPERKKSDKNEDHRAESEAPGEMLQNVEDKREKALKQMERAKKTRVSQSQYCVLTCRSVSVGSYKVTDQDAGPIKVLIGGFGIKFTLPSSVSRKRKIKVHIPEKNISSIQANLENNLPVIFLKTDTKHASGVRRDLGMDGNPKDEQTNYYCPKKGSSCQQTIKIIANYFSQADAEFIRIMFWDTLKEIDYPTADKILMDITSDKNRSGNTRDADSPAASTSRASSSDSGGNDQEATLWIYKGKNTKIPISPNDISCLGYPQLLNDKIIDLWLSVIYTKDLSEEDQERTFVYDSCFYSKLAEKIGRATEEDGELTASERKHARVAQRTNNVDIFEKDFLIMPMNDNGHWFVAIICFPGMQGYHDYDTLKSLPNYSPNPPIPAPKRPKLNPKKGTSMNQPAEIRVKHPCIVLLDSFAGEQRSTNIFSTLRQYLTTKKGADRVFNVKTIPGLVPKVSQQPNCTDSGVFMLQHFESFFSHPLLTYDMNGIDLSWVEPVLAENKRKEIYAFIKRKIKGKSPLHLSRIPDVNFDPGKRVVFSGGLRSSSEEDDDPDYVFCS